MAPGQTQPQQRRPRGVRRTPCAHRAALDIEDLDLPRRWARVVPKGGRVEWIHWSTGTARLLPRLIRGRTKGPVFLSHRRLGATRGPGTKDLCPSTGRARLGYDRARTLFGAYTGW